MSKRVQIRNVPEALHRKLNVPAADAGQTRLDMIVVDASALLECLLQTPLGGRSRHGSL